MRDVSGFKVVIAGADIADVEGLLRLQRLVGAVEVTLLFLRTTWPTRPARVLEPFTWGQSPTRYRIARIASDANARWMEDGLA